MPFDDEPVRLACRGDGRRGLLATVVAVVAGVALLVAGFIFSLLILSVVAVAGLTAWGWLWWKTRALRRHLRERMEQMQREQSRDAGATEGVIIEGEASREDRPPRQ